MPLVFAGQDIGDREADIGGSMGLKSTEAYRTFLANRRFGALDGLRALSVLAVIWQHVGTGHGVPLLNQGYRGVDFFFAISGFLITTLLLRERDQQGRVSLRNFYIRRFLRIFPLYYAVLALYCLLAALTLSGTGKGERFWANLPAFLTYTSNWFVGLHHGEPVTFYFAWSLATEEQFYLFWPPLLVLLLSRARQRWIPGLAAVLLVGVQIVASTVDGPSLPVRILSSLAPAILLGAAAALLLHFPAGFQAVHWMAAPRASAPFLGALLLVVMFLDLPTWAVQVVMVALVVSLCIREDTVLHPMLRLRPLAFVGGISYGMYLMHMLAANLVRKVAGHDRGIDVFLLSTLVVIGAAYVSFRFFESPLLHQAGRFRPGREAVRQP